jgi:Fe-Mn family superoxide dismutase
MKKLLIFLTILFLSAAAVVAKDVQVKDFSYLLGTLNGISDELLKQHFQLYEGYVKNFNSGKTHAQNGAVLHEMYFSNLSGKPSQPSPALKKYLTKDFGSYENYVAELKTAAKSARPGWVITAYNKGDGKIYNYTIDLHDERVPINAVPLLVMDVWEHAFALDYGINKAAYIDAFIENIDWNVVSERLKDVQDLLQIRPLQ